MACRVGTAQSPEGTLWSAHCATHGVSLKVLRSSEEAAVAALKPLCRLIVARDL